MKVKKALSLVLTLVMVLSMIPAQLLISNAELGETPSGNASKYIIDVSVASDETTDDPYYYDETFNGMIDVALKIRMDMTDLTEEQKSITIINSVIAIDPSVLDTLDGKESSATYAQSNAATMKELAKNTIFRYDATVSTNPIWAIVPHGMPTRANPTKPAHYTQGTVNQYAMLYYKEGTGGEKDVLYAVLSGNLDNYVCPKVTEENGRTIAEFTALHLYLEKKEGKSYSDVANAIRLVDKAEVRNNLPNVIDPDYIFTSADTDGGWLAEESKTNNLPADPVAATYTVEFNWYDGGNKAYTDVAEGTAIVAPTSEEIGTYYDEADGGYYYGFDYWKGTASDDPVDPMTTATADAVYTAVYKRLPNDKSALETEIGKDETEVQDESTYTADSWANYQAALLAAQTVFNNPDASAQAIGDAANALAMARAALTAKVSYTITFNWKTATEDKNDNVTADENAVPEIPDGATANYENNTTVFNFAGWKDANEVKYPVGTALPAATADATYTAYYTPVNKEVTITFNYVTQETGETQSKQTVKYGDPITVPEIPAQPFVRTENEVEYKYTFVRWDPQTPAATAVYGDPVVYTAVFDKVQTHANYDEVDAAIAAANEKINSQDYAAKYEETARTALGDAIRAVVRGLPESRQDDVTFMAQAIDAARADLENHIRHYDITFDLTNAEDVVVNLAYGANIAENAPASVPGYSEGDYDYTFNGTWNPALENSATVTGTATYTAQYDEAFVVASNLGALNDAIAAAQAKENNGTTWTQASKDALDEAIAAAAQYTDPENKPGRTQENNIGLAIAAINNAADNLREQGAQVTSYTVQFLDWNGTEIDSVQVDEGNAIDAQSIPDMSNATRPTSDDGNTSYPSFKCWTVNGEEVTDLTAPVTAPITYVAKYNEVTNYANLDALNDAITAANNKVNADDEFDARYANAQEYKALIQAAQDLAGSNPPPLFSQQQDVTDKATALNNFALRTAQVTVTFKETADAQDNLYQTTVDYGTQPSYAGATPTKEGNAQYSYEFAGWDNGGAAVYASDALPEAKADTTYVAVFQENTNTYTITWKNDDGTELKKDEGVAYGTTPAYDAPANPTKQGNAQYSYTFAGWTPEIVAVTGDATYTATYNETVNKYTVTWKNGNETIETDENVPYGTMPSFDGTEPTQDATEAFTYTFAGWEPEVKAVEGDVTYTATFTPVPREYEIKFVNGNDELQVSNVAYGQTPVYNGQTPTQEATDQYTYEFAGWDPEIVAVTGDATYTATYTPHIRSYDIKFTNGETVLKTISVEYGQKPVYDGVTPTKDADAESTYTFDGWTKTRSTVYAPDDLPVVDGEADYNAHFASTPREYEIKFVNYDGAELQKSNVAYGETPVYNGETPTKAADAQYTYTFDSWDPAVVAVTGDATYTATFSRTVNQYPVTVKYKNADGTWNESTTNYDFGATPELPATVPTNFVIGTTNYEFTGWDNAPTAVEAAQTYTAQYNESTVTEPTFTVDFQYADNAAQAESKEFASHTQTVQQGNMPSVPTPSNFETETMKYEFTGWDKEIGAVEADAVYVAQYTETPIVPVVTTYEINF